MYAFLCLLIVLLVLYVVADQTKKESFVGEVPLFTKSEVTIPASMKEPAVTELPVSEELEVEGTVLPGALPVGPYQQLFRNAPYVYQEPSLVRTNRARILELLERVKGFLAFQAQEIEDRSDPAIQLPLQTARGDFKRLESEANVLQRNPGLQPQMTELDVAQIDDNLAYLQREVELIGSNRPFQSPVHDLDLEGFVGSQKQSLTKEFKEGFVNNQTQQQATPDELKTFSQKLQAEILRLSASGTTDPIVHARVGNLTKMKSDVDEIVSNVNNGNMLQSEIPIMSSSIDQALKVMGKPTQPLPQILKAYDLPAPLASLLPTGVANDPESKRQIGGLISKYANDFFQGASTELTFKVNYVSPREVKLAEAQGSGLDSYYEDDESTITKTGFPSKRDLDSVAIDESLTGMDAPDAITDPYAMDARAEGRTPAAAERGPSHFDWRRRAYDIVDQIKKRGMNPKDFGADLKGLDKPSSSFSWKGFTQMVCTRLQATDSFKMDEMCGCPPKSWKGWNA